ncbi:CHC2 zinc finger domain-containing protein [Sphingomonas sp. TWP1-3-1]|uniref:CHC2 zinc finger domain-containing protein n=1 Tax=Sphingomonas sp. TWP1-3-1 TaxID=2804612 RepID=UPI003CFAD73D
MTEASPTPKQIKAAVSLFDVIDSITPLQRVGYDGRGACPFHRDQPRELHVDALNEIYRCFSCGRQGDVIRWTMDHERVDEEKAMQILSRRAGLC